MLINKMYMKRSFFLISSLLLAIACDDLNTENNNNPDRETVLSTGGDLVSVLEGAYITWWQSIHGAFPVIGLSVAADAYSLSLDDFGARRMGEEPRKVYNNRLTEETSYRSIVENPWRGCLSAVSSANDVINALNEGITIDNGGAQDQALLAAAHFIRGVSWGYLGLMYDKTIIADENTDFTQPVVFTAYKDVIEMAVNELSTAVDQSENAGADFVHAYFNGVTLDLDGFIQLCNSYAARFLAQYPRTAVENSEVNWELVLALTQNGIEEGFAPLADGNAWQSYHRYVFAETGEGPFWARVDQRIVAAIDTTQPARYPEVNAKGEMPLENKMATSNDERIASDFLFFPANNFPVDRGEWHFSHYKHHRNITDPGFAGNGSSEGPMPVFLKADNELLKAEAQLRLNRVGQAIEIINAGTYVTRGGLQLEDNTSQEVAAAIMYERSIELLSTAPMNMWFYRRRIGPRVDFTLLDALGGLQTGTPAQLPVPADELNILGLEPYNFGGPQDPEGIEPVF